MDHIFKQNRRIGIFGGSFNPPTIGHKQSIEFLLSCGIVDEVWVMPCGRHLIKKDANIDWQHRLAMCLIAFEGMENVRVSPYDCVLNPKNSTIDLYRELRNDLMKHDTQIAKKLFFIIGQDNAEDIKTWKKHEELIETIKFMVLPRGDIKPSKFSWYLMKPHKFLKKFKKESISSTDIRKGIEECIELNGSEIPRKYAISSGIKNSVACVEVYSYIKQNNLYGLNEKNC